ncbi:uncharacterized protein LOC108147254 [Drosophila elegans]|uniref:uncharacterized protein LOC108147254 n=1 Tax=Drosophila elegans TaxID=30023 RepID=UPI0007E761AB|nr:uncharacterized protein LOC108147254 [Drosophila elegans]
MCLALFSFLIVFGFGFLGQHQANADCDAATSDLWKDDTDSDEGSCPSLKNVVDETLAPDLDDQFVKDTHIDEEKKFETKTEVRHSVAESIMLVLKFLWQAMNWWFNWK